MKSPTSSGLRIPIIFQPFKRQHGISRGSTATPRVRRGEAFCRNHPRHKLRKTGKTPRVPTMKKRSGYCERSFPLNSDWLFIRDFPKDGLPAAGTMCGEHVDLPHANTLLPYNYLDEQDYQFVSGYSRTLLAPEAWKDRRVFLRFEGVMAYAEVFCNGRLVRSHKRGGYTPFTVELSDLLTYGEENTLLVRVDSTERTDFPPCGNVVDYLTYGGIYREVSLEVTEPITSARCASAPGKTPPGKAYRLSWRSARR